MTDVFIVEEQKDIIAKANKCMADILIEKDWIVILLVYISLDFMCNVFSKNFV